MRVNMLDVSPKGTPVKQSRDVRHASLPNPLAMPHSVDDDDELAPTGNLSNVVINFSVVPMGHVVKDFESVFSKPTKSRILFIIFLIYFFL